MTKAKIKVLVVDDSSVVQMSLVHILNSDPQVQVIGVVPNGKAALRFLAHKSPDLILMDINMPEMDGLEATRRIMETTPMPIVICTSSASSQQAVTALRSVEAGAVACIKTPPGREHQDFPAEAAQLLQTVKLMSEIKVVHRWPRSNRASSTNPIALPMALKPVSANIELIGIGASTGGPPVLHTILADLPENFAAPMLVVQHIAKGFLTCLVDWLNQTTRIKVQIGEHGMQPMPGHMYLAPDEYHMGVDAEGRIALSREGFENGVRPSVAHLFHSLAEAHAPGAVGVLLTGMGKDGARELKQMKERGATTIVQDRETSVVHGMPGEAIAIGAADLVLRADQIAPALVSLVNHQPLLEGVLS